jgi:hypothetical protein
MENVPKRAKITTFNTHFSVEARKMQAACNGDFLHNFKDERGGGSNDHIINKGQGQGGTTYGLGGGVGRGGGRHDIPPTPSKYEEVREGGPPGFVGGLGR